MPSYLIPFDLLTQFVLTLARVGGLVSFAPFFGSSAVSRSVRLMTALALTWALFPVVSPSQSIAEQTDPLSFSLLLLHEILIGFVLGFVSRLLFSAFEVAGQLMGFQMGFGFIQIVDPQTQVQSPFLAIFLNLIAMLTFLGINGHHWLLQSIAQSYELTLHGSVTSPLFIQQILRSSSQIFVLGLKLAAPIVVVLFITDVLLGVLGRAAPQLHILIIGLPAKAIIGFILLTATAYSLVPFFGRHLSSLEMQLITYLGVLQG